MGRRERSDRRDLRAARSRRAFRRSPSPRPAFGRVARSRRVLAPRRAGARRARVEVREVRARALHEAPRAVVGRLVPRRSVAAAARRQGHAVAEGRRDGGVVEGLEAAAGRRVAPHRDHELAEVGGHADAGDAEAPRDGAGRLQAAPEGRRRDRREAQGPQRVRRRRGQGAVGQGRVVGPGLPVGPGRARVPVEPQAVAHDDDDPRGARVGVRQGRQRARVVSRQGRQRSRNARAGRAHHRISRSSHALQSSCNDLAVQPSGARLGTRPTRGGPTGGVVDGAGTPRAQPSRRDGRTPSRTEARRGRRARG